MSKKVIILRGLPGSGKSTIAKQLHEASNSSIILSTDEFFYKDGVYNWTPELSPRMHLANQFRFIGAMLNGVDQIIIDNTNIHLYAMNRYLRLMLLFKEYEAEIIHVRTKLNDVELAERNIHGVPRATITKMRMDFESLDPIVVVLRGGRVRPDPDPLTDNPESYQQLADMAKAYKKAKVENDKAMLNFFGSQHKFIREVMHLEYVHCGLIWND